jgi:hypothetical protein
MGCDIHPHIEIKIKGEWHYYAPGKMGRNYLAFAKMAGVRNHNNIKPISSPKGFPKDVTYITKVNSDRWGIDGHSHSWLSSKELLELFQFLKEEKIRPIDWDWTQFDVFLFGNSISGFIDGQREEEYPNILEDVRVVFWFDN